MGMVATCPGCGTCFRITDEQLNTRQGDVRCGHCARIFNAFATLSTLEEPPSPAQLEGEPAQEPLAVPIAEPFLFTLEDDEGPEQAATPPPLSSPTLEQSAPPVDAAPTPAASEEGGSTARPSTIGQAAPPDTLPLTELPPEPQGALPMESAVPEQEASPAVDFAAITPADEKLTIPLMEPLPSLAKDTTPADFGAIRPEPREEEHPGPATGSSSATRAGTEREKRKTKRARAAARRWPAWAFGICSVLMALGLAAQATYFYRTELAARYPELKPYLSRACKWLQCDIPLPRDANLLGIEASELEAANPAHPSVILLRATLRNRAKFVQGYPSLQLSLTNAVDQVIARRIFTPREYLASGTHLAAGMPSAGETVIKLYLNVGDLKAIGYRLYVFYP